MPAGYSNSVPLKEILAQIAQENPDAIALIANENSLATTALLKLKSGNDSDPIFCIPGMGGHPMSFFNLAQHIQHPSAIYGVHLPVCNCDGKQIQSITEIAEVCVDQILRIAPSANIHLIGYSYGGVIAFEIAHLFRLRSGNVCSLIMLDSFLPSAIHPRNPLARFWAHARRIFKYGFGLKTHRLLQKDASFASGTISPSYGPIPAAKPLDLSMQRAFETYRPQKSTGDIVLIQPMETPEWFDFCLADQTGGWGKAVQGNIRTARTSGNHLSMLHPLHVDNLAKVINSSLAVPMNACKDESSAANISKISSQEDAPQPQPLLAT